MNSSTPITAAAPDQTRRVRELIELTLALDPEARTQTMARLIAASLHGGPGTALEHFAATGELDASTALEELNDVVVPIQREPWLDALGRHIIASCGDRA